jgi:predicted secreted acid phosphatase
MTVLNLIRALILSTVLFFSAAFALPLHHHDPRNLGIHKIELMRYHDNGKYAADIAAAIREAKAYLQFRVNQNARLKNPNKLALVLDLDETALSNYDDLKHFNFGGTPTETNAAEADGHDAAIPETLSLFKFAKSHGVAVFFITGRKQYERQNTEKNLRNVGYHNWDGLLMEPDHYNKDSAIPFKVANRKKITQMGYDIVLDVGDQLSDLKGGYADMVIKVPNPYYYIG